MKTSVYEADPFTTSKGPLLTEIETDYRFEKNDEIRLHLGGRSAKYRIIYVSVELRDGRLSRELVALKI